MTISWMRPILAVLFLAACVAPALAQQPRTPVAAPKKPEAGKMFDDWGVECEPKADKTEGCFISQSQHSNPGNQRIIYFRLGYIGPKGEPMVVVSLPLGIDLATGAAVKFEPGPQIPLIMQTCEPSGCRGVATLDAAGLKALREAKGISVLILPWGSDKVAVINLSLKGLQPAFASLR